MKELIAWLETEADLVLFDSPPALVVTDAVVLGTRVDGVVLVNDAGRTRANETRAVVEEFRRMHVNLMGIVLNRMAGSGSGYYHYYYYEEDGKKVRREKRGWLERLIPWLNHQTKKAR